MYNHVTSEQRSQIFALLQKKSSRKEIAEIVNISESTLSWELKRNSMEKGHSQLASAKLSISLHLLVESATKISEKIEIFYDKCFSVE